MTDEEFMIVKKAERKAKRIASEMAMELHDLVEDRLPAAYEDLPKIAQDTYDACAAWAEASAALKAAEQAQGN